MSAGVGEEPSPGARKAKKVIFKLIKHYFHCSGGVWRLEPTA